MVAEIVIAASSTATVLLPALYFGGNAALNFILPYRRLKTLIVDMKELVEKGVIERSHGREAMMQEMISGVMKGSLILHGPPGCGKTALLEELACRIIKDEVPSLKNWHVIRLNLRVAKGDAGLKSQIDNTLNGGVENKLRLLVSYVGRMSAKGKHCILIIDEIQDLLFASNISIFDSFKEELARKQLHIIGATTDVEIIHQLRSRVGTGSGMERRIAVIELKEMTQDEAADIIESRKPQPLRGV